MSELWQLGVAELAARLEAGELDAGEVVAAFAARASDVDRALNCFVSFAESPAPAGDGPLRGIPYAYKDVFAHAGMAPGLGLRRPDPRAGVGDAAALARLEAQGAVPLGRLQLDPLAYSTTGLNPSLGDVRNPLAPERIAGGSSTGAAAAVAAGAVAVGTDTGGSVRIPAAYCGVTGLKPTFGRLPTQGVRASRRRRTSSESSPAPPPTSPSRSGSRPSRATSPSASTPGTASTQASSGRVSSRSTSRCSTASTPRRRC